MLKIPILWKAILRSFRLLCLIDNVDHLSQAREVFAVEMKQQTGQMQCSRIVRLLRQRFCLFDLSSAQNVRELSVQSIDQARRRRMIQTDHQIPLDEAIGVIITIERLDLTNRLIDVVDDLEQTQVALRDVTTT